MRIGEPRNVGTYSCAVDCVNYDLSLDLANDHVCAAVGSFAFQRPVIAASSDQFGFLCGLRRLTQRVRRDAHMVSINVMTCSPNTFGIGLRVRVPQA